MRASCGHELPKGETRKRGYCTPACFLRDGRQDRNDSFLIPQQLEYDKLGASGLEAIQ